MEIGYCLSGLLSVVLSSVFLAFVLFLDFGQTTVFEIMKLFALFVKEFYLVLLVLNLEIICLRKIVFCQGVLSFSLEPPLQGEMPLPLLPLSSPAAVNRCV